MRVANLLVWGTALVGLVVAGCGDGAAPEGQTGPPAGTGSGAATAPAESALSGEINVDGSSTVYRISLAAQEDYMASHPKVNVVVNNHGTGGGFSRYLQGEVDIVDASRPAKPDEESKAKAQGLEWAHYLVGYDGITVVVNPANDFIKSLSVAQLKAIWAPNSKVKTWKDVDPSWPDRKIVLYSPDKDSGTFEFFTEAIVGKAKSQRDDIQASSDDNTLVSGVAGDKDGIGYFGYAYYEANKEKLKAVPVQKGDAKPVLPNPETILDKSYRPLSRPLFIYVKNSSARRPEMADFLKYYLKNVRDLAKKGGYVAPTDKDVEENDKTLAGGSKAAA
jgi:phosphate transport system substrate-binding protein